MTRGQPASLADAAVTGLNFSTEDRRVLGRGDATYRELCISCHGPDGQGAPMQGRPPDRHWRHRSKARRASPVIVTQ